VVTASVGGGGGGCGDDSLLYKEAEQPYEAFEYTDAPRLLGCVDDLSAADVELLQQIGAFNFLTSSPTKGSKNLKIFLGQASMKLPSFGGSFHISYIRTLSLPASAATLSPAASTGTGTSSVEKVVQRRVKLAESAPLVPRVAVHGAHPDARSGAVNTLFSGRHNANATSASTIRRRGAGPIINHAQLLVDDFFPLLTMWVEDMSHIKALNIVTALNGSDANTRNSSIGRTMAWAQKSASSENSLQVFVEVDIITINPDDPTAGASIRTAYGVLEVSDSIFTHASVDLSAAYGLQDAAGRFVCRLPYVLHTTANSDNKSRRTVSAKDHLADPLSPFMNLGACLAEQQASVSSAFSPAVTLQCAFCRADVIAETSVTAMRPLPTGLLDNVSPQNILTLFLLRRKVKLNVIHIFYFGMVDDA
jgi:hypothetical protein